MAQREPPRREPPPRAAGDSEHEATESSRDPREAYAASSAAGSGSFAGRTAGLLVAFRRTAVPGASWTVPVVAILGIASLFFLVSFWLDVATSASRASSGQGVTVSRLFGSILDLDIDQARNTLGGLGEVMAAVLGLALTVSSIIVQLAATRFTPHITALFFRARTNLIILGFFVTSSVYVLWVNFSIGDYYLPNWGVLFSMLLMTASLLLLFPYFAYVFDFLDPEKIVGRIMRNGLEAATPIARKSFRNTDARQFRAVEAVEHLANIGLNALQQKDKGIASESIDSLCEFGIRYGESKAAMRQDWLRIPGWNRQSSDFVSLSDDAIEDLRRRATWLEWKVLRQYQMLFGEALGQIKDTCYLIAIDTRRLGEAAGRRGDLHALDLAIKFFNTYLRATINAADIRTAYNILHQYRQLAEFVLLHSRDLTTEIERRQRLEHRALQIARFLRYYSAVAYQRGLPFITEVIAHDIGTLCDLAFVQRSGAHDEFLAVFLAVDEHAETKEQEKSLRGVRRAQIKLATTYLLHDAEAFARRIHDDMLEEPHDRLRSIWQELESLESREFWEVNDRGTNFDYLAPEQKNQLETYFAWFPGLEPLAAQRARFTTSSLLPEPARPPAPSPAARVAAAQVPTPRA